MLHNNCFKNVIIENKYFFSLGTPEQVREYERPFLFDLDGTLVNTDDIYTRVWQQIMKRYNISVDVNFFTFFIQGKNDISFLNEIIPDISPEEVTKIGTLKDSLFIEYLNECEMDITVKGAKHFIENNSNRRICIVTNCNRKAAEFIVKKIEIDDYIQFLICSEDCNKPKPSAEPYITAINMLQCDKDNCIIFEDSNSGYKSAKSTGGASVCLIVSSTSSDYIKSSNEYKIQNYTEFDIDRIKNENEFEWKDLIKQSITLMPVLDIELDNIDIKTGFICDIKALKIVTPDCSMSVILKLSNNGNELSNVAEKLNLYRNEVHFYEKISGIINVNVPKLYCSFSVEDKHGIVLENLNNWNGIFNLDLNNNIDLIMSIIGSISCMHNRFHFQSKKDVVPIMTSLKRIDQVTYYKELINSRFHTFLNLNAYIIPEHSRKTLIQIYNTFDLLVAKASCYPLNFCHGDLKSPNIFYNNGSDGRVSPIFLDWQYIHLNKGISDIAFLLVESTNYDETVNDIVLKYYFKKSNMYQTYEELMFDFRVSLCIFPLFVMVWFNSENKDNLLDKVFPITFMKNTLRFYDSYIDSKFFDTLLSDV